VQTHTNTGVLQPQAGYRLGARITSLNSLYTIYAVFQFKTSETD
jgi:hypothetical protein